MKRRVLSMVLVIAMTLSLFTFTTNASTTEYASGTCGDTLTWVLDSKYVLTISGEGERLYKCTYAGCDESYVEFIDCIDHTVVIDEAVAATTTSTGLTEGSHCSVCGEVIVWQYEVPKIVIDETTCTVCGATKTATIAATGSSSDTGTTNPFTDIQSGSWYYKAVLWAVNGGITKGTSDTTFSPTTDCTRAQIVTFLWRAAGSPEPTTTKNPFTDVKSGTYYYKAVLWAVGKGLTTGTSATTFSPNKSCTRAEAVTFLYRYAGDPSVSATSKFTDVGSAWYTAAVSWAVQNGITAGTSATTFSPNTTCNRAMIVTFLYRYDLSR